MRRSAHAARCWLALGAIVLVERLDAGVHEPFVYALVLITITLIGGQMLKAYATRLAIDSLGLDLQDRRYLTMIADIYKGGPVGVETLAAGLSEPRDTIEDVIEPYLLQVGLIARTARGRMLNASAWKHLGLNPPAGSQDGLFDNGK